jgi:hypothetical protein
MSEIPKAYEPQAVEDKWYPAIGSTKTVSPPIRARQTGLFHRHPAAQRHRRPHPGPRPQQHHPGHPRPPRPDDRPRSPLAPWHRSRRASPPRPLSSSALAQGGLMKHRRRPWPRGIPEKVWEWKESTAASSSSSSRNSAASCDWSRERFTMDPDYSRAVQPYLSTSTTRASSIAASAWSIGTRPPAPPCRTRKSRWSRSRAICGTSNIRWLARTDSWSSPPLARKRCSATKLWPSIRKTRAFKTLHGKKGAPSRARQGHSDYHR